MERESGLTRVVETWFPGHMILPFVAMVVMVGGGGRWPDGGAGGGSSGRKVMLVRKLRLHLVAAALLAVVVGLDGVEAANPLGTPPGGGAAGAAAAAATATSSGQVGDAAQQEQQHLQQHLQQLVHSKPSALGFVPGAHTSATALERANDPTWQEVRDKVMAGASYSGLSYTDPPRVHVAVDERTLDPSQYISDVPRVNALGSVPKSHTGEASTDPPKFNLPSWFGPEDMMGADDEKRPVHQGERQDRADLESRVSTNRVASRSESDSSQDSEVIVRTSVHDGGGSGKAGDLLCQRSDGGLFSALHGVNPFIETLVFEASTNPLCKSTRLICPDGSPADMQFYVEAIAGPMLVGNSPRKLSDLVVSFEDDDDDGNEDYGTEDERMLAGRSEYTLRKSHPACLSPVIQCSDVLGSASTGGEVGGLGDALVADSFDGDDSTGTGWKGRGKGWMYDKYAYGGSSDTRDSNDRLVSRDDVASKGSKGSKGSSSHASYFGRMFSRSSSVSKQSKSGSKHGRGLIGEGESKGYAAVSTSSDQDSVEGLATKDHVSIKTRDYPRKGRWKKVISSSDDRCQQDTTALYRCPNDKVGMPYRDRSGFFLVEMTACNPTLSGRRVDDRRSLLGDGRFTLSADSKAASSSKAAVGGLSSGGFGFAKKKKQQMVWTPSGFVGSMVSDGLQMKVTRLPAGHEACQSSPIAVYKCQGDSRSTPFRNRRGRFMEHLDLTQGDLLCGEICVFVFAHILLYDLYFAQISPSQLHARHFYSRALVCSILINQIRSVSIQLFVSSFAQDIPVQ